MRPLRLMILLLVVANGLAYVWFTRPATPGTPSAPATRADIKPLVLLSERAPDHETEATVAGPTKPVPSSPPARPATTPTVPVAPPAESSAARPHTPGRCLEAGPFPTPKERQALRAALAGIDGLRLVDRDERLDDAVTWWVALPRHERLADARAVETAIAAQGVEDIAVIPVEKGFIVSLGVFHSRQVAERRRRRIAALGYDVSIRERRRPRWRHWLELHLPDDERATTEALERDHPEAGLRPIACP